MTGDDMRVGDDDLEITNDTGRRRRHGIAADATELDDATVVVASVAAGSDETMDDATVVVAARQPLADPDATVVVDRGAGAPALDDDVEATVMVAQLPAGDPDATVVVAGQEIGRGGDTDPELGDDATVVVASARGAAAGADADTAAATAELSADPGAEPGERSELATPLPVRVYGARSASQEAPHGSDLVIQRIGAPPAAAEVTVADRSALEQLSKRFARTRVVTLAVYAVVLIGAVVGLVAVARAAFGT